MQLTQRKRPGSWVGRSHGSPQPGHDGRRRASLGIASFTGPIVVAGGVGPAGPRSGVDPRNEEPVGPVAVRECLQKPRVARQGEIGCTGGEIIDEARR